jgi:hypothetical protein
LAETSGKNGLASRPGQVGRAKKAKELAHFPPFTNLYDKYFYLEINSNIYYDEKGVNELPLPAKGESAGRPFQHQITARGRVKS